MSKSSMQLDLHDAIKKAYMTKVSLVVVEGKDDLSIYSDLLNKNNNKFNIKPIEYFKGCNPGCNEIEEKVSDINQIYNSSHRVYNYFRGVVDSDVKEFRGEKNERAGILYLNTYSFENSFITENTVLNSIKLLTSLTNEQLDEKLTEKVIQDINSGVQEFYYITLEALKNAVDENYNAIIGFSDGYERPMFDTDMKSELARRRSDLDNFALEKNINKPCILDMKKYCKGKWHLRYFLKNIISFIDNLHTLCGQELVECPLCESGDTSQCLYKKSVNMDVAQLISHVKSNIENADLEYVYNELSLLA